MLISQSSTTPESQHEVRAVTKRSVYSVPLYQRRRPLSSLTTKPYIGRAASEMVNPLIVKVLNETDG